MTITRINSLGMVYQLTAAENTTIASLTIGKSRPKVMTLSMTLSEVNQAWYDWQHGQYIQVAFKNLPAEQREFLMTGLTPAEWNETFGKEEE